jgi:hypothetical protein
LTTQGKAQSARSPKSKQTAALFPWHHGCSPSIRENAGHAKENRHELTLGLLFHLTRREAAIVPYIGIGSGVYFWRLTEVGDFIGFSTPSLEIFFDYFEDLEISFARESAFHGRPRSSPRLSYGGGGR